MSKDAILAAPPVGVGGLVFLGVTLNEWVMLGTLLYTIFLIIDKLPAVILRIQQAHRWLKEKRNGKGK